MIISKEWRTHIKVRGEEDFIRKVKQMNENAPSPDIEIIKEGYLFVITQGKEGSPYLFTALDEREPVGKKESI